MSQIMVLQTSPQTASYTQLQIGFYSVWDVTVSQDSSQHFEV